MSNYIGTKTLAAQPMTRGEYNAYRGWIIPADEQADDAGYLVEYESDGNPNDQRHLGYISWSPKDVFDASYLRLIDTGHMYVPPHIQRVVGEYTQLMDKYLKLGKYIASPASSVVPPDAMELLTEQHSVMGHYASILKARIDRSRA